MEESFQPGAVLERVGIDVVVLVSDFRYYKSACAVRVPETDAFTCRPSPFFREGLYTTNSYAEGGR